MNTTTLQRLLGIELPVIQAPMAGVQDSELALAVSSAGGLGSLPCAMLGHEAIREALVRITTQTSRPYNVNFFCHQPPVADAERAQRWQRALLPFYQELGVEVSTVSAEGGREPFSEAMLELLAEFSPPVVSFHFGLPPTPLLRAVRAWGAKILSSATTVEEALWLEDQGVDVIIAQGLEAGGHRGSFLSPDLSKQMGTFALLPQMVKAVQTPVVAAGGIADARSVLAAFELGASGVQVGTAYLLCPECHTSELHRTALKGEGARHTALTNVFTGRPARSIVNRLVREVGPISDLAPEFPLAAAAVLPLRTQAEQQNSSDFTPLWAGQNASGCREVSAGDLTRDLVSGLV